MELFEAIKERHSVRSYLDKPIEEEKLAILRDKIDEYNRESHIHIQLVTNEPVAFTQGMAHYGKFSGVKNYFVVAGPKGSDSEQKCGYYGEYLVLLAQSLGLNTCWVGLTYKKVTTAYTLDKGEKVYCVIALGYGATQGVQHPLRPEERFVEAQGELPQWFHNGMQAALLAPTAMNQQKFKIIFHPQRGVEAKPLFSVAGYTNIDLGIVKCHFEIGAGKENFDWV